MDITYFGHSSFKIKGKTSTVVCDPFENSIGLKFPKTEANIVTVSHNHADHNNSSAITGAQKVVSMPGEYEIGGVSIFGVPSFHDDKKGEDRGKNVIFVINIDGVNICHLGDLGQKTLTESQLSAIGNVDILLVPTGGTYTLDPEEAAGIVSAIEPQVVIPMHYKQADLDEKMFSMLEPVEKFVNATGLKSETLSKLTYKPGDLPEGEQKIYILTTK